VAELLVMARDNAHGDATTDRRGCYKRGDVVAVMPDGHQWGAKEGLPRFVRIKVPALTADVVRGLADEQSEDDAGIEPQPDPAADRTYRRRRWRVVLADLPLARRNELQNTGETTITRVVLHSVLRRKRDSAQFTDL
jgi:hypothetical protein